MKVSKENFMQEIKNLKKAGFLYLIKITAVDYIDRIEAVYFFRNLETDKDENLSVDLDAKNPQIPTIMEEFPAADWYEREMSEMFGIKITERDAERLLLEKWDGKDAPLRKSFEWGKDYKGV